MSLQRMLIGGEMGTLINSEHLMEKMRNEVVGIFPFIKLFSGMRRPPAR